MLKLSNLTLPPDHGPEALRRKAAAMLGVAPDALGEITIVRQSIDARKKSDVRWVYTVAVDVPVELADKVKGASRYEPPVYVRPMASSKPLHPPVVVGMGPAGLFAALTLARAGAAPIILERGRPVEERGGDVARFWTSGQLDPASNVQFGEGGAGAFSDGKLSTGTHDSRISHVLEVFAAHGAPGDIRYSHKPHIGTDVLRRVIVSLRQELLELGCEIRFGCRLDGLEQSGGVLRGALVSTDGSKEKIPCEALVLAPGHSARDTFAMLLESGVPMEAKPFAIGVRIEHRQLAVSAAQYGAAWADKLPPSDYKLACHLPNGRSAFTFCVCPGGQVVAAASEPGLLVTNGMSERARAGENINGGFLVGVSPADFGGDTLAGVEFQRRWEAAAFALGGRNFHAPVQTVGDFLAGRPSSALGEIEPTYRPGVAPADLRRCLPKFVTDTLAAALPVFDRKLRGFAHPAAVLTGVETRSSSPVRILRDEGFQSTLRGLYPCGEGAGYAGGITSAAVDGIKTAEALLSAL